MMFLAAVEEQDQRLVYCRTKNPYRKMDLVPCHDVSIKAGEFGVLALAAE